MAKSIEYWAKAFHIYSEGETGQTTLVHETTAFADSIFHDATGYDPFMEYDGTLWLLHYNLVKAGSWATAWEFTFNFFSHNEFTEIDLRNALTTYIKTEYPEKQVAASSIVKDSNAILRMYTNFGSLGLSLEDSLDSPFTRLSLIGYNQSKKHYFFHTGNKFNLPDSIIASISLDYILTLENQSSTFAIKDLTYPPYSPGRILKLSEYAIEHAFSNLIPTIPGLHLTSEAGISLLSFTEEKNSIKNNLLKHYYKK